MTIEAIYKAVMEGNAGEASSQVEAALSADVPANDILNQGCIAAMQQVGQLFEEGEYFVPEMLIAARAMQSALNVLKPHLAEGELGNAGTIVIGTVAGDLHDIGKNLVGMMMEGAGFTVVDLGTDVSAEEFLEAVQENDADMVGLSALLTTTMVNMKMTVEALKAADLNKNVKVIIGGAPVTDEYAQKIGAHGFALDASQAVKLGKSLMGAN